MGGTVLGEHLVRECGKLVVLDRLLVKLKATGHRWVGGGGGWRGGGGEALATRPHNVFAALILFFMSFREL
jgi:hypothetical protein